MEGLGLEVHRSRMTSLWRWSWENPGQREGMSHVGDVSIPGGGESKCKTPPNKSKLASLRESQCDRKDVKRMKIRLEKQMEPITGLQGGSVLLCMVWNAIEGFWAEEDHEIYSLRRLLRLPWWSGGYESPANSGDMGSIPGPGRYYVPWGNLTHIPQLLSPLALEPMLSN